MKMIVSRTLTAAGLPFVLDDLKDHLRIDFADDDSAVQNIGLTAAAEIEQFAQLALLNQTINVTVINPAPAYGLVLPIGPVAEEDAPTVEVDGQDFTGFDFVSGVRGFIAWSDDFHDLTPNRINIDYQAGFGEEASDVPADLAQALMDQAALHYDGRSPMDAKSLSTSPHMARIAARYRGVHL